MTRKIETTVYKFDELSDAAKEKAREWFREADSGDTFWSKHILQDEAPALLKRLGYCDPKIYYSGFWSQGDGACFVGSWYSSDCKYAAVVTDYAHDSEVTRIATALGGIVTANPGMSASIKHTGHYYHEMSVSFDVEFDNYEEELEGDEVTALRDSQSVVDESFRELSRDLMRWIYKALETEYEYTQSDEYVDEAIRCNEYEFTEEGEYHERTNG